MKVHHDTSIDYLSIDFTDEVEAKSAYEDGIIVRYDKKGHVIGIDITDSMRLFASTDLMTLQQVCEFLGVSESTIRRKIRAKKDQVHQRRESVPLQEIRCHWSGGMKLRLKRPEFGV